MNKKAILVSEVLKVIVAIIGISLLFYLALQLYGIFNAKSQLEQARSHLDIIVETINILEENGGGTKDYVILNPKDWSLSVWPSDLEEDLTDQGGYGVGGHTYGKDEIPEECKRNNWERCICLCGPMMYNQLYLTSCNSLGVCLEIKKEIFVSSFFYDTDKKEYIFINSLTDSRKPLVINLTDDVVRIYPKNE